MPGKNRVRLVLFDVFDTLCTPRLPVPEQYAAEAQALGLNVTPAKVKAAFKPAFSEMNTKFPLYGKYASPPLSPESWWGEIITRCMRHAGVSEKELQEKGATLVPNLLERFESEKGYRLFPETIETLRGLLDLGVKITCVSNSDPRILRTLSALRILPLLSCPPSLSWDVEAAKPDRKIYEAACKLCMEDMGEGVIMVGDELEADAICKLAVTRGRADDRDYRGALAAGIEARLLRRDGAYSEGAVRHDGEDLTGVHTIKNLSEVLEEVKRRNA